MQGDGKGWLFAPVGLKDGPLPIHYEAVESPVPNLLYDKVQYNPDRAGSSTDRTTRTTLRRIRSIHTW
jgi:hypothetical protein